MVTGSVSAVRFLEQRWSVLGRVLLPARVGTHRPVHMAGSSKSRQSSS
ncbi:hypothetical protein [Actinoallomurus vinaceus]